MSKVVVKYLFVIFMFFSCSKKNTVVISGSYDSIDGLELELQNNSKFYLDIPTTSTKVYGTYKIKQDKLILNTEETEYQPYEISIPPQTNLDGYEFMIKGRDWGPLRNVYCKIEQDGKVVQEAITNELGIVRFNFYKTGKLMFSGGMGWEYVKINLSEFRAKSAIIEIEREKFTEGTKNYEFKIKGVELIGQGRINHWKLIKRGTIH